MATFAAGKGGRIAIGGSNMANKMWDVTHEGDELDTSNFEGNGKYSWLVGLEKLSWNLGSLWDSAANPLADPPGLYVRDNGNDMKLYLNRDLNKYWNLPTWMCSSAKTNVTVNGLVEFNASGKAQEDFSYENAA